MAHVDTITVRPGPELSCINSIRIGGGFAHAAGRHYGARHRYLNINRGIVDVDQNKSRARSTE